MVWESFRGKDFRLFSLIKGFGKEKKKSFKSKKAEHLIDVIKSESQVKSAGDFKLSGF